MKVTWIMQTNMGASSDIQTYVDAVKNSDANVIEVEYVPFSNELPAVSVPGPIVLYGSVNFIQESYKAGKWLDGIFGTPETFTYEAWAEHYGSMLLNSPDSTELMTIADFSLKNRNPEDYIFIRPQHDTKSLVGQVWIASEFNAWCQEAKSGKYAGVNHETPIVVATPYGIEAEWRLFVVDNQIISSSQYHKKGRLSKSLGAPEDVLNFAQKVIAKWKPTEAYTLDICRSAGNCYIMEVQGFNSAGHYAADIEKVARAVNVIAMNTWQRKNSKVKQGI